MDVIKICNKRFNLIDGELVNLRYVDRKLLCECGLSLYINYDDNFKCDCGNVYKYRVD